MDHLQYLVAKWRCMKEREHEEERNYWISEVNCSKRNFSAQSHSQDITKENLKRNFENLTKGHLLWWQYRMSWRLKFHTDMLWLTLIDDWVFFIRWGEMRHEDRKCRYKHCTARTSYTEICLFRNCIHVCKQIRNITTVFEAIEAKFFVAIPPTFISDHLCIIIKSFLSNRWFVQEQVESYFWESNHNFWY